MTPNVRLQARAACGASPCKPLFGGTRVSAETKVLEISRFEIAEFRWRRLLRTIVLDASSSADLQAFQGLAAASSCTNPLPAAQMSRIFKPAENRHVRAGAHNAHMNCTARRVCEWQKSFD